MNLLQPLTVLVTNARRFANECKPHNCVILRILSAIEVDHARMFDRGQLQEDALIDLMAKRSRCVRREIVNLYNRDVTSSLIDYSQYYQQDLQRYKAAPDQWGGLEHTLNSYYNSNSLIMVHYRSIKIWRANDASFGIELFDDNEYSSLLRGCLIERGLAYPTILHLLEASYRQKWHKWEQLWEKYY